MTIWNINLYNMKKKKHYDNQSYNIIVLKLYMRYYNISVRMCCVWILYKYQSYNIIVLTFCMWIGVIYEKYKIKIALRVYNFKINIMLMCYITPVRMCCVSLVLYKTCTRNPSPYPLSAVWSNRPVIHLQIINK